MTGALLGIGFVAVAFVAAAFVQIRAGCGSDCGSCDRPCELRELADEERERS